MFSLAQSESQLKKKLGQGEGALNRPRHDALSHVQIKKKEAWVGNEKPAQR